MHYQYKPHNHNRVSLVAFILLLIVSLAGLALWRLDSVQLMTVQSGSMAPAIRKGDAVFVEPVTTSALRVGDVVSYRSPRNQATIITHRIVRVETDWKLLLTKGDNTQRVDDPVPDSAVIGKVTLRLAYLGYLASFLRSPLGLAATVYAPALLIIVLEIRRLITQYATPTYRLMGYTVTTSRH
ncbi:MAG TPA: signal peptidase I [Candidatus Microsaccharimonas sp.]|nr:signal peptidase I [Candidatus Microsaccharimonas sp.]